jgi:hypothetical protein
MRYAKLIGIFGGFAVAFYAGYTYKQAESKNNFRKWAIENYETLIESGNRIQAILDDDEKSWNDYIDAVIEAIEFQEIVRHQPIH